MRTLALTSLATFELADHKLGLRGWSDLRAVFLNFCIDNDILSKKEMEAAVADRIRALGRESYNGHINAHMPPDHTVSPQALAFAVRTGGLTAAETDKIKFDHGETRYTFFKGVEDTLVANVVRRLRAELVPA